MKKICDRATTSPMCNDWELYTKTYNIAKERNVPMRLMIGIMSKESGLGTLRHHTNRADCKANTYNWHGSKGYHNGDRVVWGKNIGPGCRLYVYESLEQGMESLANTLGVGYGACLGRNTANGIATCIAYRYVGNPDVAEWSRVSHVISFYQ